MKFILFLMLSSCITIQHPKHKKSDCPPQEVRYVDIDTYLTWGTTRLIPIARRPIPKITNPSFNPNDAYLERKRKEKKRHIEAMKKRNRK